MGADLCDAVFYHDPIGPHGNHILWNCFDAECADRFRHAIDYYRVWFLHYFLYGPWRNGSGDLDGGDPSGYQDDGGFVDFRYYFISSGHKPSD